MKRFLILLFVVGVTSTICLGQAPAAAPAPTPAPTPKKGYQRPTIQAPAALDRSAPPAAGGSANGS